MSVGEIEAAANSDADSAGGLSYELTEDVRRRSARPALRREVRMRLAAAGDDLLQCLLAISNEVEGAMEGNFHRVRKLDEGEGTRDVDLVVRRQEAGDDTCGTGRTGAQKAFADESELRVRITEVAGPGTQHNVDGQSGVLNGGGHEILGRRDGHLRPSGSRARCDWRPPSRAILQAVMSSAQSSKTISFPPWAVRSGMKPMTAE